ncbi:gephyrin-like molybdotransferase Glp [Candidatus Omnitrophota bacterium]
MIEFEQALKLVLGAAKGLGAEEANVDDSVGRVLMEDIYSKIEMPPFNKSAMDGYAVRSEDIKDIPAQLKNVGLIQAGQIFAGRIEKGECVKIMTGAALPKTADSVVMVEDTHQSADRVEIKKSLEKWRNVCFQGEDIKKGQKVLQKGRVISISDIALMATVGKSFVKVSKRPTVAVLNTGGEITPLGNKLRKGQIYNSNGPQLLSLLKSDSIRPCYLGIARDRRRELTRAMEKGLQNEVFLISGGVSMGDYDLVPGVLKSLGVKEIFHNVETKPGRPLFFGRRNKAIVFGIPGNPVANFLVYHIYIRPAIYKLMGRKPHAPQFEEGIVDKEFRHKPGRKHFVPVRLTDKANQYYVAPVGSHGSADILALSKADAFMVVDADVRVVKARSHIKFTRFK